MNAIDRHPPQAVDDDLDDQARELRQRQAAGETLSDYDKWHLGEAQKAAKQRAAKRAAALSSQTAETRLAGIEARLAELEKWSWSYGLGAEVGAQLLAETANETARDAEAALKGAISAVEGGIRSAVEAIDRHFAATALEKIHPLRKDFTLVLLQNFRNDALGGHDRSVLLPLAPSRLTPTAYPCQ